MRIVLRLVQICIGAGLKGLVEWNNAETRLDASNCEIFFLLVKEYNFCLHTIICESPFLYGIFFFNLLSLNKESFVRSGIFFMVWDEIFVSETYIFFLNERLDNGILHGLIVFFF